MWTSIRDNDIKTKKARMSTSVSQHNKSMLTFIIDNGFEKIKAMNINIRANGS